ncbi:MAG TPA: cation diffusion facilitator family transporter [Candidatus Saccharimonadales bacterium]|nr:cation diffusion facilitator family transporter [Candidatus Saccharimonadales bacterium]
MAATETDEPQLKHRKTQHVLQLSFMVDGFNLALSIVVAALTGSVVMLVTALQSFAELSSAGILLYGKRYANRRPTKLHPFGFGKELYFWTTIAAFVIIAATGVLAYKYGYQELLHPTSFKRELLALIALVVVLCANLYSFYRSSGKLLGGLPFADLPKIFMVSPLLAAKTTVVLDIMGAIASVTGLTLLSIATLSANVRFDGIGAVLMGTVYFAGSVALLFSIRGLVTGQSAPPEIERKIRDAARAVPEVRHVLGMRTMMLGSDKLLVNIEVHLRDKLSTDQVEDTVERIKHEIEHSAAAEGMTVHVEPDAYEDVHKA